MKVASPVLNGGDGETANTALCPYPTPAEVVEQLLLLKYSEVALADWMDVTVTASAYWVNLTFHEMPINGVKVIAAQISYIILGRDVLNQFHITLDGPNLALEMKVAGR